MNNTFLSDRTARDIDKIVEGILKDLGNPEPPLRLEVVRALLDLDRAYYSSTDHTVLQEKVHQLKMAGKQILNRPGILLDAVRKCSLTALWLPDQKRILIDSELPIKKQRWGEAHEIGHSVIPWHESISHGDKKSTLSYACQQQLETEANFTAGRLLFLRDRFREQFTAEGVAFAQVQGVAKVFKNSLASTLWRVVESLDVPCLGLVSCHPYAIPVDGTDPVRYFIRSKSFAKRFSSIGSRDVFQLLPTYCHGRRGPIGDAELLLCDDTGIRHEFVFESFNTSHDILTLAVCTGARSTAYSSS